MRAGGFAPEPHLFNDQLLRSEPSMADLSRYQPVPYVKLNHPEWSKNAILYQINTRQFTPEGTFRAAEAHFPRLKALGVDLLWLMPVHPIGEMNRKGSLGSPYSVKDYFAVNPEFGSLDDLKHFVSTAHGLGFHVILDWVANHTAWDNALVHEHPEWYARDWKGDFMPTPWWNWDDIIDLDYTLPEVRQYMTEALKFWVRDVDVDGYRCDVAGMVPTDFWNNARQELDAIKPVFMLAEWDSKDLHAEAFDATYAWTWHDCVHNLATGRSDLNSLFVYYSWNEKFYPQDIMRMLFLTNHDKNSWEGTEFEVFGAALETVQVLSVISEGIPMIYNGQEAGNARRLKFFEKDPITWRDHPLGEQYKKLFALKKANTALWNGRWGARMIPVYNNVPTRVLSFVRQNEQDKVFAVLNFSPEAQVVTFKDHLYHGVYTEFSSGQTAVLDKDTCLTLPAWGYQVFVK
jgi:1,4-alpha-glucan branching enzyme